MPRKHNQDTSKSVTFPLRKEGLSGLNELDQYLSGLRKRGAIKGARRHVGYVSGSRREFVIEFEYGQEATFASLSW